VVSEFTNKTEKESMIAEGCSNGTSKSLVREIDLDGSSQKASAKQGGDTRELTDIIYIVTICHACMPICRQCQHMYLIFQENLIV